MIGHLRSKIIHLRLNTTKWRRYGLPKSHRGAVSPKNLCQINKRWFLLRLPKWWPGGNHVEDCLPWFTCCPEYPVYNAHVILKWKCMWNLTVNYKSYLTKVRYHNSKMAVMPISTILVCYFCASCSDQQLKHKDKREPARP